MLYECGVVTHDECEVGRNLPSLLSVLPVASLLLSLFLLLYLSIEASLIFSVFPHPTLSLIPLSSGPLPTAVFFACASMQDRAR